MTRTGLRGFIRSALVSLGILALAASRAGSPLTPVEAADHIGESATVCGEVVSARYATGSRGQPTFLNLDKAYPSQVFTVLIWGSDRSKFGNPETTYANKRICATGTIETYKGKPEIIARAPSQIRLASEVGGGSSE